MLKLTIKLNKKVFQNARFERLFSKNTEGVILERITLVFSIQTKSKLPLRGQFLQIK